MHDIGLGRPTQLPKLQLGPIEFNVYHIMMRWVGQSGWGGEIMFSRYRIRVYICILHSESFFFFFKHSTKLTASNIYNIFATPHLVGRGRILNK